MSQPHGGVDLPERPASPGEAAGLAQSALLDAWRAEIDFDRLDRLGAGEAVDPLKITGPYIGEAFSADDGEDVLVWQSCLAPGEYYFPPLTLHVLTLCAMDIPWGLWYQDRQVKSGTLMAGSIVVARACHGAAYSRSNHPGHFLHIAFPAGHGMADPAAVPFPRDVGELRDPALALLLKALLPRMHLHDSPSPSFVASVAHAVRLHLAQRTQMAPARSPAGLGDHELHRITAYLRQHITDPACLAGLALAMGTSERTLARRFKQCTGDQLGHYFLRMRLGHAYDLLISGRHSVTDVAQSLGFADLPHFSRHFRKRYGVPPSALLAR